jgi:uncharacterized protein YyaL (SSP411 family)
MALASTLPAGTLIDRAKTTRLFNIWVGLTLQLWKETTVTETMEYVALTRTLAVATVDADAQPESGTYTWTLSESQRYVGGDGSYSVKRMLELKTYEQVVA